MNKAFFDIAFVGGGLTSASVVARLLQLRPDCRILVLDTRTHIAGNCYGFADQDSRIHQYGPHTFHSPSPRIVSFLSAYTDWKPKKYSVTAEVEFEGRLRQLPFPYSAETIRALGRALNAREVVGTFYRGYTQKMWGRAWEDMPASIRSRVPANDITVPEVSDYFLGQFVALPQDGYTRMIEKMFAGSEIRLGVESDAWLSVGASHIVYTGRPDLIPIPGSNGRTTLGEHCGLTLNHRTLDIEHKPCSEWAAPTGILNICHSQSAHTRKTCYRLYTGGESDLVSTETPRDSRPNELTPYYPMSDDKNIRRYQELKAVINKHYANITLAGRLGSHQYLDMYQAVGQGIAIAEKLAKLV